VLELVNYFFFSVLSISGHFVQKVVIEHSHHIDNKINPFDTVAMTVVDKQHEEEMACTLPEIDPLSEEIRPFIRHPRSFECSKIQFEFSYVEHATNTVRLNRTLLRYVRENTRGRIKCYWKSLSKGIREKNKIDEGHTQLFNPKTSVPFPESGMMQVKCYRKEKQQIVNKKNKNRTKKRVYYNVHVKVQPIKGVLHAPTEQELSVDIFVFESMSTARFKRHMRSLNGLLTKLNAFRFEGYNKIADNTYVNLVPLFTGLRANNGQHDMPDEFHKKHRKITGYDDIESLIWKEFSKRNYVTAFVENEAKIGTFAYSKKKGFVTRKPFDYFFRPYFIREKVLRRQSSKFCFGNNPSFPIQLNLTQDLFRNYGNKQKIFAFNNIVKPGHDEENDIERVDEIMSRSISDLIQNGAFNKTILFFLGDHGPRFGDVRMTKNGFFEERLPFLSIVLPPWFIKKHSNLTQNMRLNQRRLTTPFDIHKTLKDILNSKFDSSISNSWKKRGISLFNEIPLNRTCALAGIPQFYCCCYLTKEQKTRSLFTQRLAKSFVTHINAMLAKRKLDRKCEKLALKKIVQAKELQDRNGMSEGTTLYLLAVQTTPGEGVFEVLLTHSLSDDMLTFHDGVSRLNKYGSQGSCIDSGWEKYCYCKKGNLKRKRN